MNESIKKDSLSRAVSNFCWFQKTLRIEVPFTKFKVILKLILTPIQNPSI